MSVRKTTHAGPPNPWYDADPKILSSKLDAWLAKVPAVVTDKAVPIPGARLIIAPHAGYYYSGAAAAWAYKCLDLSRAKRVFILGPNHQNYGLNGLALSSYEYYETPFGNLKLDLATMQELRGKSGVEVMLRYNSGGNPKVENVTRGFTSLPKRCDDDEHSLEMHLPYIYKIMSRTFDRPEDFPPIVPIMVGSTNSARERIYGKILAPYLEDPDNAFVVSSDFCHWGGYFHYHYYLPASSAAGDGYDLKTPPTSPDPPIHDSIRRLDRLGMDAIEEGSHRGFRKYIAETNNSICGRHPIGVLMVAVEFIRNNADRDTRNQKIIETYKDDEVDDAGDLGEKGEASKDNGQANIDLSYGKFKFVKYDRSDDSLVVTDKTSVSYASAYAIL